MKYTFFILLGILFFATGCKQAPNPDLNPNPALQQKKINELQKELDKTNKMLDNSYIMIEKLRSFNDIKLVHVVYLKLKDEGQRVALEEEIKTLKDIEQVHDLTIGNYYDLGDPRAMSEYSIVFHMRFKNEEAYRKYQTHEIHLELKENAAKYLAGPPVTYDYWVQ